LINTKTDNLFVYIWGNLNVMKRILLVLTLTTLIFACKKESNFTTITTPTEVEGCMDTLALNYSPEATVDDESCEYAVVEGCTDPTAINYNAAATIDDGSCEYAVVEGCTDPTAINYNAAATIDDGSCEYAPVSGCMDPFAYNYDPLATVDDGSCEFPPSMLKLSSITINEMPMTNNGANWDVGVLGFENPDVFYVLKQGDGDISTSSSQDDISAFPISFTDGLPYTINNLSQEYTIVLYDNDQIAGVGENELIGSCSFTPNDHIPTGSNEYPTEINIQSAGIDMTLAIEWLP